MSRLEGHDRLSLATRSGAADRNGKTFGPGRWWPLAMFTLVSGFLFAAWLLDGEARVREDALQAAGRVCRAHAVSVQACDDLIRRHGDGCFRLAYHFGTRSNPRTHLDMEALLACLSDRGAPHGIEWHID